MYIDHHIIYKGQNEKYKNGLREKTSLKPAITRGFNVFFQKCPTKRKV